MKPPTSVKSLYHSIVGAYNTRNLIESSEKTSPNPVTNVRLSFIRKRQAIHFSQNALNIFQQLHILGLPPNPIIIARYQDAMCINFLKIFGNQFDKE